MTVDDFIFSELLVESFTIKSTGMFIKYRVKERFLKSLCYFY